MQYIITVALTMLGTAMGSFVCCLAWRSIRKESVLSGRSHCDACGHVLSPICLVPVLSYIFLLGRCKYCRAKIPPVSFITEILMGLMYGSIGWMYFGLDAVCFIRMIQYILLVTVLVTASLIDLETLEIPNKYLVICASIGICGAIAETAVTGSFKVILMRLIGSVAVSVPLLLFVLLADKVLKKETMGGADIKLFAVIGLNIGSALIAFDLIAACLTGIVFGVVYNRAAKGKVFPFAPAIAVATWVTVMVGPGFIDWYSKFF